MTSPKVPCSLGDAQGVAQLVSSLRLVMPRVWPEVRGGGLATRVWRSDPPPPLSVWGQKSAPHITGVGSSEAVEASRPPLRELAGAPVRDSSVV